MGCAASKLEGTGANMQASAHEAPPSSARKAQLQQQQQGGGGAKKKSTAAGGGGATANGTAPKEKAVGAPASAAAAGSAPAPATGSARSPNPASEASTSSSHSAAVGGGGGGGNGGSGTPGGRYASSLPPRLGNGGNGGGAGGGGGDDHTPGYSSGASTPADDRSLDGSTHRRGSSSVNPKSLLHSNSVLGLDKMIEDRKGEGDLKSNVVHIEVPFGKPIEEVYDGVHDGPVLGSGISGLVRLITHKSTGVKYAVKCLDLGLVETEEGLQQLREEIYIMCQLDHPNIVRLEEVYESHSEIYLVQELCLGGELFDRLDEQPDYHYTEAQCARLVKQMLNSVRYIHSKGIIHRDLKLENFLFSSNSPDSELKMIDFGLSKHFKFGEVQHEAVGTPYTVAPEVIRGCYDERCDVWAIGVIAFLLLSGDPPFGGCGGPEPLMEVRENILRGRFEFEPDDVWDNVSPLAKDFIRRLLVTDPNRRPTAREVQRSQWLKEWANRDRKHKEDNELNPNVVRALVNFKEYSDMRKLLCEVLSFTLLPDQIEDLRREFEKLDTDGSGEISLAGLKQVLMNNAGAGSLGALTEEEVEDIFNAMRVRKTETRIHWHEFIAAGLSQCKVDDRNLKLAFDRLDSDHKGYITFENVMDLLGNDASQSEDAMRRMWGDSMKAVNCKHARIQYEDFLLLMKGQTRQDETTFALGMSLAGGLDVGVGVGMGGLDVVHETEHLTSDEEHTPGGAVGGVGSVLVLPSGDVVATLDGTISQSVAAAAAAAPLRRSSQGSIGDAQQQQQLRRLSNDSSQRKMSLPPPPPLSAPSTPIGLYGKAGGPQMDDMSDGPLMMDEEEDIDEKISEAADKSIMLGLSASAAEGLGGSASDLGLGFGYGNANLTPPQSPRRGAGDYITPISQREKLSPMSLGGAPMLPGMPSPMMSALARRRSRSVDDQDNHPGENAAVEVEVGEQSPVFMPDVRRAMLLPEHNHNHSDIENVIKDVTKTPLVVNRKLYRAHRQMRLAVLEASKRFEEEQITRTKKKLEERNGKHAVAGLTMRHGLAKEMSSESIRQLLKQQHRQQQSMVDKANKRGGRGRRTRKKTVSDMAGMMSSPPPGDILMDPAGASSKGISKTEGGGDEGDAKDFPEPPHPVERHATDGEKHHSNEPLRQPTTPGVFRKTVDPFKDFNRYQNMVGLKGASGTSSFKSTPLARGDMPPPPPPIAPAPPRGDGGSGSGSGKEPMMDSSMHSMRSSASDGNLPKMKEPPSPATSSMGQSTPSPQVTGTQKVASSPSWPPPPPL